MIAPTELHALELRQAVARFGDDLDGIVEAVNGLIAAPATLARGNEELARQNARLRARVRELEEREEGSGAEGRHGRAQAARPEPKI